MIQAPVLVSGGPGTLPPMRPCLPTYSNGADGGGPPGHYVPLYHNAPLNNNKPMSATTAKVNRMLAGPPTRIKAPPPSYNQDKLDLEKKSGMLEWRPGGVEGVDPLTKGVDGSSESCLGGTVGGRSISDILMAKMAMKEERKRQRKMNIQQLSWSSDA
jgi:hypothetical protein